LRCRANHRHIVIVARVQKSPRREIGCGLFRIAHLKTASR
jgi:hypothetical protein